MALSKDERIALAKMYVQGIRDQDAREDDVSQAFRALSDDNMVFSLSAKVRDAFHEVMKSILGDYDYDWLTWYMWEADFGSKSFEFSIDETEYVVNKMTLDEFLQLVICDEVGVDGKR